MIVIVIQLKDKNKTEEPTSYNALSVSSNIVVANPQWNSILEISLPLLNSLAV